MEFLQKNGNEQEIAGRYRKEPRSKKNL